MSRDDFGDPGWSSDNTPAESMPSLEKWKELLEAGKVRLAGDRGESMHKSKREDDTVDSARYLLIDKMRPAFEESFRLCQQKQWDDFLLFLRSIGHTGTIGTCRLRSNTPKRKSSMPSDV